MKTPAVAGSSFVGRFTTPYRYGFNGKEKDNEISGDGNWKIPLEDVQLFAGHKYPSTTERYRRKDINEQQELINKFHPLR